MQVWFVFQKYLFDFKDGAQGNQRPAAVNFWCTYLLMYSNKLVYLKLVTVLIYGSSPSKIQSYLNF